MRVREAWGAKGRRRPAGAESEAPPHVPDEASSSTAGASARATPQTDDTAAREAGWRAALARVRDRYPELPPAPHGRPAQVALGVVLLMAIGFAIFFIADAVLLHAAYRTHAEDLGIMDQALWNTVSPRGQFLHQTICNIVGDSNCLGDIPRTAIHFEPILLLVALFYLVAPSPLTPIVLQVVVVAAGALPAYWIASRRLSSAPVGVVFAALYLAFPALQSAVLGDFHAVTLAAALVMFALYFMLSRNNWGLWITCLLAMTTKEEIPLLVVMLGLSVALLQRRWRLGLALVGVALAYLGLALYVIHLSSPIGHSSTTARYTFLGDTPVKVLTFVLTHPLLVVQQYLLGPDRIPYLRKLLAPTGYLALLSPLTLLIAGPELAINLLSSDPLMRSGGGQYNAAIVPVIVLATIESVALLGGMATWLGAHASSDLRARTHAWLVHTVTALPAGARRLAAIPYPRAVMIGAVLLALGVGVHEQRDRGLTPLTWGFHWPQVTAHDKLANTIAALIPPAASVSAQTDLVPHLSQRRFIYLFPDHDGSADFVFLDVTGNIYPLQDSPEKYVTLVQQLLTGSSYSVVAARDGYLLLAHGPSTRASSALVTNQTQGSPYELPEPFFSFTQAAQLPAQRLSVHFGPSLELIGYDLWPRGDTNLNVNGLTVTTYWRVTGPVAPNTVPTLVLFPPGGQPQMVSDLPSLEWLPVDRWPSGKIMTVASRSLTPATGAGVLHFGIAVLASSGSGPAAPLTATLGTTSGAGPAHLRVDTATGAVLFANQSVIP